MTKKNGFSDSGLQGEFNFDAPQETQTGAFNLDLEIRALLSKSIRRWCQMKGIDRFQFCGLLSSRLGRDVSQATFNNWCADSHSNWRLPLDAAGALCDLLNDWSLFDLILNVSGRRVLQKEEDLSLRLGAIEIQLERLKQQRNDLRKKTKG